MGDDRYGDGKPPSEGNPLIFFLVLIIAVLWFSSIAKQCNDCEARGGHLVKGVGKFVCVESKR